MAPAADPALQVGQPLYTALEGVRRDAPAEALPDLARKKPPTVIDKLETADFQSENVQFGDFVPPGCKGVAWVEALQKKYIRPSASLWPGDAHFRAMPLKDRHIFGLPGFD